VDSSAAIPRVIFAGSGQRRVVEETTSSGAIPSPDRGRPATEPEVTHALDGDIARVSLSGELTGFARRPLMRVLTDLLLQVQTLHRVELDLHGVTFMNSAGLAVLVQALRMTSPRAIELVLVGAPSAVIRPLQLSGLWHRFTTADPPAGATERTGGATPDQA
jgi:stage II sporulation protein AA (anti-sigma F factor antagonist)